jgi:hypothetical protein
MRMRRIAATIATVVLGASGLVVASATTASAHQIWHQSVGRASADAECPKLTADEVAAGWSEWAPSWAQWANDGKGGHVCDRSVTWAFDAQPPPQTGCVLVGFSPPDGENLYAQFYSGDAVQPSGIAWFDANCTQSVRYWGVGLVYADSQDRANLLCYQFPGFLGTADHGDFESFNPNVWLCDTN